MYYFSRFQWVEDIDLDAGGRQVFFSRILWLNT